MLKYVFVLLVAAGSPLLFRGFESAQEGVPDLIAKLNDGDPKVRAKAAQDIAELGPLANMAVPTLIERMDDPNPEVAFQVDKALRRMGPGAAPALIKILKSKAPTGTRIQVAWILGHIRPESKLAEDALLEIFDDPDSKFKERTLLTLAQPAPPAAAAMPKFLSILNDKRASPDLRRIAISSLGRFGPAAAEAAPLIWQVWLDQSEKAYGARSTAAYALVAIVPHDPALLASLRKLLSDDSESYPARESAAQCLGRMGPHAEAAIPDLAAVLKEKIHWTRAELQRPIEERSHRSDSMRQYCLDALVKINPKSKVAFEAVADAAQATTNTSSVREVAIFELPKFTHFSDEAVSVLLGVINPQAEDYVVRTAIRALSNLGPRAKRALPDLALIANGTHPSFPEILSSSFALFA